MKRYADNQDEGLESRLYQTLQGLHAVNREISLGGYRATKSSGNVYLHGRPLCNMDRGGGSWGVVGLWSGSWDINAATVVCKMLGFPRATNFHRHCHFGGCTGKVAFAMGGFKCRGDESHIKFCPRDNTLSSDCGENGFPRTRGNPHQTDADDFWNIVGVECDAIKL